MEPTETQELELIDVTEDALLLDALERLEKNPDFQKVIMEGYLKNSVLNSVSLLAHPAIKQRGERPDVMEDLVAASNLGFYLRQIRLMGEGARADLMDEESPDVEG